jgi:hypothetical protein
VSVYTFAATITLPDGRTLSASVDVPGDHPATAWRYFAEHTEYVQIATAQMLRNVLRGDGSRARDEAEDAVERTFGEVPF